MTPLFDIFRDHMNDTPTTGELLIEGEHFCYTLEDPWINNAPNISCIPEGQYFVKLLYSPHFGRPYPHILGVPGRTGILIHSGNTDADTQGCILVGDHRDENIIWGGLNGAYPRFLEWFASIGNEAEVTVKNGEVTDVSV